jgi:hypothetical protein
MGALLRGILFPLSAFHVIVEMEDVPAFGGDDGGRGGRERGGG